MNKESMKKVEEFKKEYGMQELSADDLDNVGGGMIGLNTQESVASFCKLVDVLIVSEGKEEALKIISSIIPSTHIIDYIKNNGIAGLGTFMSEQMSKSYTDRINNGI